MAFITNLTTTPVYNTPNDYGQPSGIDNRHGNVRYGGTQETAADSGNWSSSILGQGGQFVTIVSGTTLGVIKALSTSADGSFNSGTPVGASEFSPLIGVVMERVSTGIAGLANTSILGGDSDSANVAYTPLSLARQREYFYKTAVVNGQWNIFSGVFDPAVTSAYSGAWNISASVDNANTLRASGTDIAAGLGHRSGLAPGLLTFMYGNPLASGTTYSARTNW